MTPFVSEHKFLEALREVEKGKKSRAEVAAELGYAISTIGRKMRKIRRKFFEKSMESQDLNFYRALALKDAGIL